MIILKIYLLWSQYSHTFWEYAKYTELVVVGINIPETKQLGLKVANNVDSWDFSEQREIMWNSFVVRGTQAIVISTFSF